MNTVFYDFETGGTEPHHPNIQLAAIAVDGDFNPLATFEAKIAFDESKADPEALAINHYFSEDWDGAKAEITVMADFARFCGRFADIPKRSKAKGSLYHVVRLGGYNNVRFDTVRLWGAMKRYGIFFPADFHDLDVLQAATWYFTMNPPFPKVGDRFSLKLGDLCNHFGIAPDGAFHDALADVKATIEMAKRLAPAWKQPSRLAPYDEQDDLDKAECCAVHGRQW